MVAQIHKVIILFIILQFFNKDSLFVVKTLSLHQLLNTLVVHKTIGLMMLLVLVVRLAAGHLPLGRVYLGEEGIGLGRGVFDMGDAELVSQRKGFVIDTGTADDEHFLVSTASLKGSLEGRESFGTRELDVLAGEHDVASVRQSTFRQGFEGLAAHDDGVARSQ